MNQAWIRVARLDDIFEGGTLRVAADGFPICLYRLENGVHATDDTCTHGAASLSEGYVDGDRIECPFHQGLFHIPSGKAVGAPCSIDLRVHDVRIENENVLVRLHPALTESPHPPPP